MGRLFFWAHPAGPDRARVNSASGAVFALQALIPCVLGGSAPWRISSKTDRTGSFVAGASRRLALRVPPTTKRSLRRFSFPFAPPALGEGQGLQAQPLTKWRGPK